MRYYLLVAVIAAVVTFGLSFLILKLSLRFRLYPKIRERDVHTRPTPRLGGIAMFVGIAVAFVTAMNISWFDTVFQNPRPAWAIFGAATLIVIVGVLDDIYDLDWMTKLAAQLIAAGLLAWQGVSLTSLPIAGVTVGSPAVSIGVTVLAVVLVMNAVNFIDGLDGLVAGVSLIANLAFFAYSVLLSFGSQLQTERFNLASLISACLIGACIGFLPFNWNPAKMFMGDAGALLIGLLMATSAVAVTGDINPGSIGRSELLPAFLPIVLPFAVLVVPLMDFTMAVVRRLRAGKSPFSADRKHLHHRLLDMGHSQKHAVMIFYSWTLLFSVGSLLFFLVQPAAIAIIFLVVGFVLCAGVTLAPLSRRKSAASAAEAEPHGTPTAEATAHLDELDKAAEAAKGARGIAGSPDAQTQNSQEPLTTAPSGEQRIEK